MEEKRRKVVPQNRASFEELFRRYHGEIRRYLYRLNPAHAEDLVQETFLELLDHVQEIQESNTRAWLYRVAMNKSIDLMRASQRRIIRDERAHAASEIDADDSQTPAIQAMVRLTLERLEERQVHLLQLHYNGLSYDEMADVLGVKKTSISKLLVRAKKAFEEAYQSFANYQVK